MNTNSIQKYIDRRNSRKKWTSAVTVMGVIASMFTNALMTNPVDAMIGTLICGQEEHTHSDECYITMPVHVGCAENAQEQHLHDQTCYDADGNLICGKEEYVIIHTYDSNCYDKDGNLICGMPEVEEHIHDASCYDAEGNLICGIREIKEHTHTEECWTVNEAGESVLTCTYPTAITHQHAMACYDQVEAVLNCGKEEHVHSDSCYEQKEETVSEEVQTETIEENTEETAAEAAEVPEEVENTEETPQMPAVSFENADTDVIVTVTAEEGSFPAGTTMKVVPVAAEEVTDAVQSTTEKNVVEIQAVDISFWNGDEEIEPLKPINVVMKPKAVTAEADHTAVVHVKDEGETEVVVEETEGVQEEVTFDTPEFSVYAIVYTVDFHYEVNGNTYDYSIKGGTGISLRELLTALNVISEEESYTFVSEITDVTFSNPELVDVYQIMEDITVQGIKDTFGIVSEYAVNITEEEINENNNKVIPAGDWALLSKAPFDTEETMTITMMDGAVFNVKVTDEQISTQVLTADGESYTITVSYGPDAGIPDGARLEAEEIPVGSDAYMEYYAASEAAVQSETGLSYARFFDITIKNGEDIIEPNAMVETKITLTNELILPAENEAFAVHFAQEGIEVLLASLEEKDNTAEFVLEQGSFSVTGTVVKGLTNGDYILYAWPGTQNSQGYNNYYHMAHRQVGNSYNLYSELGRGAYNYGTYHGDISDNQHSQYSDAELTWTVQSSGSGYTISAGRRYLSINGSSLVWGTNPTVWQYANNKLTSGGYYIRWNNGAFSLTTDSSRATNMYFAYMNKEKNTNLTVHYGELNSDGNFVEWSNKKITNPARLGDQINLRTYGGGDSTAANKNYRYVTTRVGTADGTDIYFRLGTENAQDPYHYTINNSRYWMYRESSDILFDYAGTGWNVYRTFANNQKDIYVIYEPVPVTPVVPVPLDAKDPIAEKKAKVNHDGTYDITLSVNAEPKVVPKSDKANVVIVYDISNSMLKKGIENRRETDKIRKDYTEPAIKSLARKLLEMNTAENQDTIELSLVMFAAKVCNEQQLNTIYKYGDYSKFENEINNIVYTNGTNWDSALEAAESIRWKDDDKVYVIFVSDGDTISRSQLISGKEAEWDGGTYHNNPYIEENLGFGTQTVSAPADVQAAVSHADAIKDPNGKIKGKIYSISAFGVGMDNLDAISTDGSHFNLKTDDPNKVFDDILAEITHDIGYKDVKITDGITDMSSSTMVTGTSDSFTYTVTDDIGNKAVVRVNQKGEVFGLEVNPTDPDLSKVTSVKTTATVKVKGADGNVTEVNNANLTYSMTNSGMTDANGVEIKKITVTAKQGRNTVFEVETATASFVDDPNSDKKSVEWDLSPLGQLKSKYKYDATFTVWPKQEAYDLLADLNNGLKFYDYQKYLASLEEGETALSEVDAVAQGIVLAQDIRDQIVEKEGKYSVKTNTNVSLTYKRIEDGVESGPHPGTINDPGQTMGLDESKVSVQKDWDVSLDPTQLTKFLTENPNYEVDLAVINGTDQSLVPVRIKPELTYEEDGVTVKSATWPLQEVFIAPGVMLSEAKAIEKGIDVTNYKELSYDGTTYYLLENGHNYTMEEYGSDWHFELAAQTYHPMVVDGIKRDVSFTLDEHGEISGITAINTDNTGVLTATNKLRSGVNIIKNVVDESGAAVEDDSTFYVKLTLKDKTNKEIKYADYLRTSDYPVGLNIVEKRLVDCGNGTTYWFIRANNGEGTRTYTYYSLNEDGSSQINGDLFPIWYNDFAEYTETNNIINGVGTWTLDGMWESGEVKAIKKGQLLQLKNVPYGTTVELTEVQPVMDGSGNITGYTPVNINGTFGNYKLNSIVYTHEGSTWNKSVDFNHSYKIAVENQSVGKEMLFRKADIASKGETDESKIIKLNDAEFELCRVVEGVSVRLYFDTADGNKVLTQTEAETKVNAKASDSNFAEKLANAGIRSTFTFNNNGAEASLVLAKGTYKLKEISPPENGYIISGGEMEFTLTDSGVTASGTYIASGTKDGKPMITVYNERGAELPHTGGQGTQLYMIFGSFLIVIAGALLYRRRRLS